MEDIGLYFCSASSRLEMGISGPRAAPFWAGRDQRRQKSHKEPGSKIGFSG